MSLSPQQIRRRLAGITATDVSAIVGVNPYRSRLDVWREKRGEATPVFDTERTKWGTILETPIRRDYAERHTVSIEVAGTLENGDAPWMLATPDGIVFDYGSALPRNGLEIKAHTWQRLYGSPGTDEIPLWELCQCLWGIAVTGIDRWDLVAFIDGQPTDYTVRADDELIGVLMQTCERFLVDNVRGGEPPDPDGTDIYDAWLRDRWATSHKALIDINNDADLRAKIGRARDLRGAAADAERELVMIGQAVKSHIGEHEGVAWTENGRFEKVTWRRNKDSAVVDYESCPFICSPRDRWLDASRLVERKI